MPDEVLLSDMPTQDNAPVTPPASPVSPPADEYRNRFTGSRM